MKTLKITLLFCLISAIAFCNVSKAEKEALLAICTATKGDNWTVSWNTNTPVSAWNGVTVELDKVVCEFQNNKIEEYEIIKQGKYKYNIEKNGEILTDGIGDNLTFGTYDKVVDFISKLKESYDKGFNRVTN